MGNILCNAATGSSVAEPDDERYYPSTPKPIQDADTRKENRSRVMSTSYVDAFREKNKNKHKK